MNPAVFLDRDGVINKDIGYLHRVEDFQWTYRCLDALKNIQAHGYLIAVVTNQSGIGRGFYTEDQYHALTQWYTHVLAEAGVLLTSVKHCPHHPTHAQDPYRVECNCRKPKPGMLLEIVSEHDIDISRSIMVGDKLSDMYAGQHVGIERCVLLASGPSLPKYEDYCVFNNLYEFSLSL